MMNNIFKCFLIVDLQFNSNKKNNRIDNSNNHLKYDYFIKNKSIFIIIFELCQYKKN